MDFFLNNLAMFLCGIAGLILLIIEAIIPGFGVCGITGIIAEILCVVLAWINLGPLSAFFAAVIVGCLTALMIFLTYRSVKKGRLNRYVLKSDESGFSSGNDLSDLMDATGTTASVLRPSGIVDLQGKRVDAQTDGEFIPAGEKIIVTRVSGNKVTVKRI